MHKISRALQVSRTNVIEFLTKMLLCLQDLKPNRLESSDNGLDLESEVFAHLTEVIKVRSRGILISRPPRSRAYPVACSISFKSASDKEISAAFKFSSR